MELAGPKQSFERPDQWIRPDKYVVLLTYPDQSRSIVVQVKATSVGASGFPPSSNDAHMEINSKPSLHSDFPDFKGSEKTKTGRQPYLTRVRIASVRI
jgi:hypothetical protein